MDLETAQTNATAKLPILKQENDNSFKLTSRTTANADGTFTSMIPGPVTIEEKAQKKNDVKAKCMLRMALPNEHQLTFNQYKDAKTLFNAIQIRFGESLDSIFNRLQKIISQLAILGKNISQEDLNLNFLRSLPSEWNTHVVVWRNKSYLDTMRIDDLYNNFKIVEQEVKRTVTSSSNSNSSSQNMAFMSSPNNLEQIHEDDLEEMDLKWQLALLSMRARRYFRKTSTKITINGSDTAGYDKSKKELLLQAMVGYCMEMVLTGALSADEEVSTNHGTYGFSDSGFNLATYKKGLASVEEQLVFYKKNEVMFYDQIVVLKRDTSFKDSKINALKSEIEKLKKEKESNQIKIDKFKNASKSLDKLIGSQISDNSRKGVGFVSYNGVPPSPTGLFAPPTIDLSNYGREEFQQPEFEGNGPKASKNVCKDTSNEIKKTLDASLGKKLMSEKEKQNVFPTKIESVKQQEKPARKPVKLTAITIKGKGWHMTDNMSYLLDFKEFDGGYVTFGEGAKGGRITGKGTLKTSKLDFEDVYFVKELQFNLFSVSQMCDKKNSVLFTDTACFVLSPDFKLPDESLVLLKVPRKNNMYSVDMKNIVPKDSLTCLVAKAILDESMLWHRRLGHINFKTINKLVKDNLVRGLPTKLFENDQTCVACLKGKQHKASSSKDETSGILKNIITKIENTVDKKVKIIRCDNRTEFKNRVINEFCEKKDIKREFSVARTPQQNGVAERRNRTLIEAARTMLADFKLPTTFWAEAVNTACYVHKRVIIVKPYNKTPYELFRGRTPSLSFMRPFGCHVTILVTILIRRSSLAKFDGKFDDGFFVGYSLTSKAFRVYNIRIRKVEENLHIRFLENKPIITGDGPKWLFNIDSLTKSMNYVLVVAGTNSNDFAGSEESNGTGHTSKETKFSQDYIVMPLWKDGSMFDSSSKNSCDDEPQPSSNAEKKDDKGVSKASGFSDQEQPESSTLNINTAGPSINTASVNSKTSSLNINTVSPRVITTRSNHSQNVSDMFSLGRSATLEATHANLFGDETEMDMSNLTTLYQTMGMTKNTNEHGFISAVFEGKTHEDLHTCLFPCFLSQKKPKRIAKALSEASLGKRAIGTKWIFMNKKDGERHSNKEQSNMVFLALCFIYGVHGYQIDVKSAFIYGTIEEEVYVCQPPGFEDPDYPDKVYEVVKALYGLHQAPRAWYETLAKYLLDNRFQRGKIDQTLLLRCNKEIFCFFQMSSIGELNFFLGLQVKQREDGIFISQDKYVAEILRKFGFTNVRTTSTPMDTEKPLLKDSDGDDVDGHLYR
ncbi:putative ribonuclease H-like domain-containing protein [Tanacetum coccineum]